MLHFDVLAPGFNYVKPTSEVIQGHRQRQCSRDYIRLPIRVRNNVSVSHHFRCVSYMPIIVENGLFFYSNSMLASSTAALNTDGVKKS